MAKAPPSFPLASPSPSPATGNVYTQVQDALETTGLAGRVCAAVATYSAAPNPVLSTSDGEAIGLPVSFKHCPASLKEAGKHGVVVKVGNREWVEWAKARMLELVRGELGVKQCGITPKKTFLLSTPVEADEIFKHKVKNPKVFGTAIIILPSIANYVLNIGLKGSITEESKRKIAADTPQLAARVGVAVWYNGVSPNFATIAEDGHLLVISYDLIYTGFDSVPQLPDNSTTLDKVRKALCEWLEEGSSCDLDPPGILTWVLDHHYPELSSETELHSHDRARVQLLKQVCRDIGIKMFAVEMKYTRYGISSEYCGEFTCDQEMYEYTGSDLTIDEEDSSEAVLQYQLDMLTGESLPKDMEQDIDPTDETLLPSYWVDIVQKFNRKVVDFDAEEGGLSHEYGCTAVVLWPEDGWEALACNLFLHGAAYLLALNVWHGTEDERLTSAEKIVSMLPKPESSTREYSMGTGYSVLRKKCANILFELALKFKQKNLFAQVAEKFGTSDLEIFSRAAAVFSAAEGENDGKLLQACLKGISTCKEKVECILKFYGSNEDAIRTAMDESFPEKGLGASFGGAHHLSNCDVVALEECADKALLLSCIYPNLQNHDDTGYWIWFFEHYEISDSQHLAHLVDDYLQSVVEACRAPWSFSLFTICLQQRRDLAAVVLTKMADSKPQPRNPNIRGKPIFGTELENVVDELKRHGVVQSEYPYFFQRYVTSHILPVLGPRPSTNNETMPKYAVPTIQEADLGPGDSDIKTINTFLADKSRREEVFAWGLKRRKKIQYMLYDRLDLEIDNKPSTHQVLKITKSCFDYIYVDKEWQRVRNEAHKTVELVKEGLGTAIWELVAQGTDKDGKGWTKALELAAEQTLKLGLSESTGNVTRVKMDATAKADGPEKMSTSNKAKRKAEAAGPKKARGGKIKIFDLTGADG